MTQLKNRFKMKFIAKLIFLFITIYLFIPYCIGLMEKIQKPAFKNLPMKDYILIGIILMIMISLNIKWFYFDKKRK